jgi:hypothetical protein
VEVLVAARVVVGALADLAVVEILVAVGRAAAGEAVPQGITKLS